MRAPAFAILLSLVAFPRAAGAEDVCHSLEGAPVERIEVYGLADVKPGVVDAAVKMRPGMIVSPRSLAKLEDAVLATGWFSRASVVIVAEETDCVLRVRVEEYSPIVEVRLEGATVFDHGRLLLPQLQSQVGTRANRNVAEKDAATIAARYRADGFEAARVAPAEISGGTVSIHVSEGRIARIDVAGARHTGAARVREILSIKPGQIYNAVALISGQAALYRTGLFSNVGFGVEASRDADEGEAGVVLTVTVGEFLAPWSSTEIFADAGQTALTVEARMRNLARGHSANARATILGASPADLANVGFDEFYRVDASAEIHLFRPSENATGAFVGGEAERVHGRLRPEFGKLLNLDTPAARAGVEFPSAGSENWETTATLAAVGGMREIRTYDLLGSANGVPLTRDFRGYGRAELGFELHRVSGVETPARARMRTGVEWNGGVRPFPWIEGKGEGRFSMAQGIRVEAAMDGAALLGGAIPWWRDYALDGFGGPLGFPREYAFTRSFTRGSGDAAFSALHGVAGIAVGGGAAVWAAPRSAGVRNAQSIHVEARGGPSFARVRAGVAAPLPGARANDLWWYATLSIGTPQ